MSWRIICVMFSGLPLTDDVRSALFRAACELYQKQQRETKLKTDDFEGAVQTAGERSSLGGFYGILFNAEIETNLGKTTVRYIVSEADIENADPDHGLWIEFETLTEILERIFG